MLIVPILHALPAPIVVRSRIWVSRPRSVGRVFGGFPMNSAPHARFPDRFARETRRTRPASKLIGSVVLALLFVGCSQEDATQARGTGGHDTGSRASGGGGTRGSSGGTVGLGGSTTGS